MYDLSVNGKTTDVKLNRNDLNKKLLELNSKLSEQESKVFQNELGFFDQEIDLEDFLYKNNYCIPMVAIYKNGLIIIQDSDI